MSEILEYISEDLFRKTLIESVDTGHWTWKRKNAVSVLGII